VRVIARLIAMPGRIDKIALVRINPKQRHIMSRSSLSQSLLSALGRFDYLKLYTVDQISI
jgi:hypothetical protein